MTTASLRQQIDTVEARLSVRRGALRSHLPALESAARNAVAKPSTLLVAVGVGVALERGGAKLVPSLQTVWATTDLVRLADGLLEALDAAAQP